jgi:hypothetical protein
VEVLFLAITLFLIIWAIKKKGSTSKSSNVEDKVDLRVEVKKGKPEQQRTFKKGKVIDNKEGGWTINPSATFPLTIYNCDKGVAEQIKGALDEHEYGGIYQAEKAIEPLIAVNSVKCKEIEGYIDEYGTKYKKAIEDLKENSEEWQNAGERDREDLLEEFKKTAIGGLYIKPYNDFEVLFECDTEEESVIKPMIEQYGYDNLYFYSRFVDSLEKVRIVPASHRDRDRYESLAECGLALRGKEISLSGILDTLKLKDLNELLDEESVKRKKDAIDKLLDQADVLGKLERKIAFRELFKLRELENNNEAMVVLPQYFKYIKVVSELIAHTYYFSKTAKSDRQEYLEDREIFKGWKIDSVGDDSCCPMCLEESKKDFSKGRPPKLPLHIGCRCGLRMITKFD